MDRLKVLQIFSDCGAMPAGHVILSLVGTADWANPSSIGCVATFSEKGRRKV